MRRGDPAGPRRPEPAGSPLSAADLDLISRAVAEDLPRGDVTSRALFPPGEMARAAIVAREPAVVAGLAAAEAVFREIERRIEFRAERAGGEPIEDGERVAAGERVIRVEGHALAILAAERTAINFLARLCGVATATRAFVDRVEGTGVRILDTRKTTPGWRTLEKAAVRSGGGENHRMNASEMILVKDNHRLLAGGVRACLDRLAASGAVELPGRAAKPGPKGERAIPPPVAFEADTLADVRALLAAGAEWILLDNMDVAGLRDAVAAARDSGRGVFLEASGGVRLENVRAIAETGVDAISVGAITHSARAVDFSLEILA